MRRDINMLINVTMLVISFVCVFLLLLLLLGLEVQLVLKICDDFILITAKCAVTDAFCFDSKECVLCRH